MGKISKKFKKKLISEISQNFQFPKFLRMLHVLPHIYSSVVLLSLQLKMLIL